MTPFVVLSRKLRVARVLGEEAVAALRREGVAAVIQRGVKLASDWRGRRRADGLLHNAVDRKHGTDTSASVRLHHLDIASENYRYAVYYRPTRLRTLQEVLASLPVRPEDYTFVDVGSGKGLVLLLAASYPFRRVIGVEFARELHEIAQRNVARYPLERRKAPIELVRGDAMEFEPPPGGVVFYLYEPFEAELARRFARRVEGFAATREVVVAYVYSTNPLLSCKPVWDQAAFLREAAAGDRWVIYRSAPPPAGERRVIPISGEEEPSPSRT